MVHLTVRGEILIIRTSIAPHTNEFRLGKLENKVQTYLALLQASLLGLQHSPPRCEGISSGPLSDETGHMMSCRLGHIQLASMLIDRIPIFPQHRE